VSLLLDLDVGVPCVRPSQLDLVQVLQDFVFQVRWQGSVFCAKVAGISPPTSLKREIEILYELSWTQYSNVRAPAVNSISLAIILVVI
jgi:hypothetical protein